MGTFGGGGEFWRNAFSTAGGVDGWDLLLHAHFLDRLLSTHYFRFDCDGDDSETRKFGEGKLGVSGGKTEIWMYPLDAEAIGRCRRMGVWLTAGELAGNLADW